MVDVERIFSFQDELGECPVWNIAEQALYWIDTKQGMIQVYDPKADAHLKYELNRKVGSIAFRKQGRLVVAMEDGFGFYNRHHNRLDIIDNPEKEHLGSRFNDGAVDRFGRFWAGTLGDEGHNSLYRQLV